MRQYAFWKTVGSTGCAFGKYLQVTYWLIIPPLVSVSIRGVASIVSVYLPVERYVSSAMYAFLKLMEKPSIYNNMENFDIFDIPAAGPVQAAMVNVEDTTDLYSSPGGIESSRPVPGQEGHRYIPWGADNLLPFRVARLIGDLEVTAENAFFNVLTCYGAGLDFHDRDTGKSVRNPEAEAFRGRNSLAKFLLDQMTDMKYYFFSVAVVILSRDGTHINRIVHKDACFCRLQEADKRGRINHIYYANWSKSGVSEVETIPLLDERDPLGDLLLRLGKKAGKNGQPRKPTKMRKFAILMRFPTVGSLYYPIPYYASIFKGGSYDEIRLISTAKRAKLRNYSSVKYLVRIDRSYWDRICMEEGISDKLKKKERIKKEKENIRDFLSNVENSGKVWISGCYVNPDGHEVKDVQIECIRNDKEGGEWMEDVQSAVNTACYAFNIHPNLVGSVPGKTQTNNSGSDKRELFTMKQALEVSFHDILLQGLDLVCRFNEWTVRPAIDMIMLTTLDQHRDAKRINPKQDL